MTDIATTEFDSTAPMDPSKPVLSVRDLVVHFHRKEGIFVQREVGTIHAVCGVSFDLFPGETLGLVGESGCGKTTTGRAILQLIRSTSGEVEFDGHVISSKTPKELREIRRGLQVVFQDPYGSLDPRMPIGQQIGEPLVIHNEWDDTEGPRRVSEAMNLVGLDPRFANRYPNEFSGGQRQRIGIARALIMRPKVLILDEPVSALDVSIQAGVVNLLEELQERLGIAYLFIAHDLSVVRHVSNRVAVMYLGRIVEIADRDAIYGTPLHPYTQALLSASPIPDPRKERERKHIVLEGDVPSPADPPSGCRFRTRCWKAQDICAAEEPKLQLGATGHQVACHFPEAIQVL